MTLGEAMAASVEAMAAMVKRGEAGDTRLKTLAGRLGRETAALARRLGDERHVCLDVAIDIVCCAYERAREVG